MKKQNVLNFLKGKISDENYEYIDLWTTERQYKNKLFLKLENDFDVRLSDPYPISYIVKIKGSNNYEDMTIVSKSNFHW